MAERCESYAMHHMGLSEGTSAQMAKRTHALRSDELLTRSDETTNTV